jgi:hypothetical protein
LKKISKCYENCGSFQNFDEEQAINIISNTFDNCQQPASIFYNSTLNPVDQLIKVHEEKIAVRKNAERKR